MACLSHCAGLLSSSDICPEEVLPFTPKILAHLLPAMASGVESIRQAAGRVNTSLMDYVVSLSDEPDLSVGGGGGGEEPTSRIPAPSAGERQEGNASTRAFSPALESSTCAVQLRRREGTSLERRRLLSRPAAHSPISITRRP